MEYQQAAQDTCNWEFQQPTVRKFLPVNPRTLGKDVSQLSTNSLKGASKKDVPIEPFFFSLLFYFCSCTLTEDVVHFLYSQIILTDIS